MNKFTFFIIITLLFSFWIFWLPGNRVAVDYHLADSEVLKNTITPWIWRENSVADGLGEYTGISLWSYPLLALSGFFPLLSIPFWLQTRIFVLIILFLGFTILGKLLDYLKIDSIGKYTGILFYLTNSYFLLLIDGGQISLALVYSIFPLSIYFFMKTLDEYNSKKMLFLSKMRIYLALSILAISILDIRFITLLILVFFIFFTMKLFSSKDKFCLFKESLLSAILTITILLGVHAYWLLPAILKPPQLPQTYGRASQVDFLSFSTIGHSLLLQQPHWYKNIFGQVSNLRAEFVLIPILIFLAPILRRKDKIVGFWMIVAIFGIFLSKGSQQPFPQIYSWLFTNIPGMSFFRDPVKFYFLIALSYSVLLSITVFEIKKLNAKFKSLAKLIKLTPFLILIYLIWMIRPIFLGQMTGLLNLPVYENQYQDLTDILNMDNQFSRIFWMPAKAPLGLSSMNHPSVQSYGLAQKRPFAIGTKGTYEISNFLRETSFMGEIFDVSGIGYIVYPLLDRRRDDMHPDNIKYFYTFSNQLSALPWISKVNNSPIPLWKTKQHQDRFFITPNIWWVVGSDSIYNEATRSANLNLSKNSLIFVEENPDLAQRIEDVSQPWIILNNKFLTDLAASFIDSSKLIFPAKNLDFDPDKSGWWKREAADLIRWRDFLQTKYGIDNLDFDLGGGWAVGEGELELRIKNHELRENKILLARVMESTKSGQLKFYQDNKLIGEINTKKKGNNIKWFEVGTLFSDGELTIKSEGDINVVNALAVLNKDEWTLYKGKSERYQKEARIVNYDEDHASTISANISYKKINPTKYKVTVTNLTSPAMLVFSENYDPLWKMDGHQSIPVYSLLNGFRIEKDGEYYVEFGLQKYVYLGLVISATTLIVILSLLINFKLRKK